MKTVFVLVFAVALLAVPALAVIVPTLSAGDGFWHNESGSSWDYFDSGSSSVLTHYQFYGTSDTMIERTGYLQFSLASLGSGFNVTSATLNLYLTSLYKSGSTTSSGWIRHRTDASTANGSASQRLAGDVQVAEMLDQDLGWVQIDVTSQIQNDVAEGYSYSVFSMHPNASGDYSNRNAGFTVTSADAGSNEPYLSIIPEPASVLFLGFGALIYLLHRKRK